MQPVMATRESTRTPSRSKRMQSYPGSDTGVLRLAVAFEQVTHDTIFVV